MSIELSIEAQAGYLVGRLAGPVELGALQAVTERLLQACVAQQQPKALVDLRQLSGRATDTQRFQYGEFVAQQVIKLSPQAGGPIRLAFVGHAPLIDPDRFGVTVAYNRGVQVLVTENEAEALAWLGVD